MKYFILFCLNDIFISIAVNVNSEWKYHAIYVDQFATQNKIEKCIPCTKGVRIHCIYTYWKMDVIPTKKKPFVSFTRNSYEL